jgi:cation diffusion facilitator CzcD-associated flavoprotein CzcO
MTEPVPHTHVAIIGTGFSGMGAALRLRAAGFDDLVLLERFGDVGGTWRDNTYPGCACDVPSNLYSFSFAPNPGWTRTYSPQPEIEAYLQRTAREGGVLERTIFDCKVLEARWQPDAGRWLLQTTRGARTADVLVAGNGPLSDPVVPDIEGLDRFAGRIVHTARWGDAGDLAGQRVAVVGTGASAIQVVPHLQRSAAHLVVLQRTAPWVLPHPDRPTHAWERRLFRTLPVAQRLMRAVTFWARELLAIGMTMRPGLLRLVERMALRHLERQVADPQLRARLTPHYRAGCKRLLMSNTWYPALQQPNVTLETDPIARFEPDAVVLASGARHEVDTVVLGTGFHVTDPPIVDRIFDGAGRSLREAWQGSPQAYLGMEVSGYPNLFLMVGPNTGLGHNSIVYMVEAQLDHLLAALRSMREHGVQAIDVRADVQCAWNERVQRRMRTTDLTTGGCSSWYLDEHGRNTTLWPSFSFRYRQAVRPFHPGNYHAMRIADVAQNSAGGGDAPIATASPSDPHSRT